MPATYQTSKPTKFLTVIDKFSHYAQTYILTNKSSIEMFKALLKFTSHHGIPKKITSDSRSEFHELKGFAYNTT